jgi:hypothetical protein
MPFTNFLDKALLQHAFGGPIWTPPSTLYVALSSSQPTQQPASNWNFTEATGGGYARVGIAYNTTNFTAVASEPTAGYEIEVAVLVAFPVSNGPWSGGLQLGWFGLFDASTAGNLLAYGQAVPAVEVVGPGYQPEFQAGSLTTALT